MIRKTRAGKDKVRVTFTLAPDHGLGSSSVVGDFNEWSPDANRLKRRSNGTFSTSVVMAKGERACFRYLAEDGQWFDDPDADGIERGPFSSDNCVVEVH